MEELTKFLSQYGLPLALIAIAGVIVLGILKYAGAFKKLEENMRHYLYLIISVGVSLLGSAAYLFVMGDFEITYFFGLAGAIYAIDQTFYNIFKVTKINDLIKMIFDWISSLGKKKEEKKDEDKSE